MRAHEYAKYAQYEDERFFSDPRPIFHAAVRGDTATLRALIERGEFVHAKETRGGKTLLMYAVAARVNADSVVQLMLKHGARHADDDDDGVKPIHLACLLGRERVVELLVRKGADVLASDLNGHTPAEMVPFSRRKTLLPILDLALKQRRYSVTAEKLMQRDGIDLTALPRTALSAHKVKSLDSEVREELACELRRAATYGDAPTVVRVLSRNVINVDSTGRMGGRTALHQACRQGHAEVVMLLVQAGAKTTRKDKRGRVPMDYAKPQHRGALQDAINRAKHAMRPPSGESLGSGGNRERAAEDVRVAAAEAAASTKAKQRGGVVDSNEWRELCDLFGTFASLGYANELQEYVDKGMDVNLWKNGNSFHPLHVAAREGHIKVIEVLVRAGVEIDMRDDHNMTALHHAMQRAHIDVARLLLKHGASVDTVDLHGRKPLQVGSESTRQAVQRSAAAASSGAHAAAAHPMRTATRLADTQAEEIGRRLLDAVRVGDMAQAAELASRPVTRLDVVDADARTPLMHAASMGNADMVLLLLRHGADAAVRDRALMTPLLEAALFGHVIVVDVLLLNAAERVDIEAEGALGYRALHFASEKGHFAVVERLLNAECDVHAVCDEHALTPLHLACANGHLDVVELLLQHGARSDARTADGRTALDVTPAYLRRRVAARITASHTQP